MQRRGLTDLAEAKIHALRKEGYVLSDDDVIAINDLSRDIQTDDSRMALSKGKPIRCGNFWLWPFTIHAKAWFHDVGSRFANAEYALAYALSHRNEELYTVTEEQVQAWSKTLKCTLAELRTGLAIIIDGDKQDDIPMKDGDGVTIHEMARMMFASHGGSIEMWEKEVSIQFIYDMLDTIAKQNDESGKSMKKERAQMAFAYLTYRIRRRAKTNG